MKVLFHCMDSCGHIAAATGLAEALAARGHQVTFLVSELHRGRFARLGFGEVLLSMKKNKSEEVEDENSKSAAAKQPCFKQTAEQLARNGLLSGASPLEKLRRHNVGENNFLDTLCEKLAAFDGQMEAAIERLQPDLLLCNQFLTPPAILRAGLPWIFQYPCNPLALYHSKANVDKLPPFYSGFPVASDPSTWREYRHFLDTEYVQRYKRYQDRLNALCGYEPPPAQPTEESSRPPPLAENADHFAKSPYLNVFDFPTELAYDEIAPTPDNCLQFEAFFRGPGCEASSERFHLPEGFLGSNEKLIYLSMGSYGGIDVQLMRRLVAVLARTPHKYIVSKGLRAEEYDLPVNCWGEAFLPQTDILPLVDLVITHGGNNTFTEAFRLGVPMLVMPLFFDQIDNAQRLSEKGYGLQLPPYSFSEQQLIEAIERLLGDEQIQERCRRAAERIAASDTEERAVRRIEEMVRRHHRRHQDTVVD